MFISIFYVRQYILCSSIYFMFVSIFYVYENILCLFSTEPLNNGMKLTVTFYGGPVEVF